MIASDGGRADVVNGPGSTTRGLADDRPDPRVRRRGDVLVNRPELEVRSVLRGDLACLFAYFVEEHGDLALVEVAQLQRAAHLARDHVRRARKRLDAADGAHL